MIDMRYYRYIPYILSLFCHIIRPFQSFAPEAWILSLVGRIHSNIPYKNVSPMQQNKF
jgi:hypothetical protein